MGRILKACQKTKHRTENFARRYHNPLAGCKRTRTRVASSSAVIVWDLIVITAELASGLPIPRHVSDPNCNPATKLRASRVKFLRPCPIGAETCHSRIPLYVENKRTLLFGQFWLCIRL